MFSIWFPAQGHCQSTEKDFEYEIPATDITPIQSADDPTKMDPGFLNQVLKDVEVVGLGECTHYTRECYTVKHSAIIHLAQTAQFNVLILEVDFGQALKWNDFVVNGIGELDQLISDSGWFTYKTKEFRDFLAAVRQHNESAKRKLHVYGMEMTYVKDNIAWLKEYLSKNSQSYEEVQEVLEAERKLLAFQQHTETEVLDYWQLYFRMNKFLQENRNSLIENSNNEEFETAERIVEIFRQYATYVSQSDFSLQTELRDKFSTRNVLWAMNRKADSKAMIWAHNGHIRRSYTYDALGRNLSLIFGDQYYSIGFKFGEGSFGSNDDDWNFKEFHYPPAKKPLFEGHLNPFETDLFIDIRNTASQKTTTKHYLNQPIDAWTSCNERLVKSKIQESTKMVLENTFDGIVFLRRTHSPTPFVRQTP